MIGNALSRNRASGVDIHAGTPTIEKNDLVGNSNCGVFNAGPLPLAFPNNYWGAATGPGPLPADTICPPGTGTATPAATKPFNVKARIKP